MTYTILPETTLAMIVRDETDNPAGGIERFLTFALPHVSAAVIVDTGSIDGTLDVLNRFAKEYPHLKVLQRQWDNFAPSRNFSLSKVKTERALVLDADEWLDHEDYDVLADFIKHNPVWGYWFNFRLVYPNGLLLVTQLNVMNPRLFKVAGVTYKSETGYGDGEDISHSLSVENGTLTAPVQIKHFLPSEEAQKLKKKNWYRKGEFLQIPPSEAAKRDGWKEENGGIYVLTNKRVNSDMPTPYTAYLANHFW